MMAGQPRREAVRRRSDSTFFKSGPLARLGFRLRNRFTDRYFYATRPGQIVVSRLQPAIAVIGVAALVAGLATQGSRDSGVLCVSILPLVQLALSLQLWRGHRYELRHRLRGSGDHGIDQLDTPRWHELMRWKLWRASVGLVFGAELALIANRWCDGNGHRAAAHTAGSIGLALLLCSPIPTVLEPLLWRLAPNSWRRVERVDEVIAALTRRQLPFLDGFDPSRGAAGRPEPVADHAGGSAETAKVHVTLNYSAQIDLSWDGERLRLFRPYGMHSTFSLRAITELVWLETEYRYSAPGGWGMAARISTRRSASLLLIDRRGFCRIRVLVKGCTYPAVAAFARAAGMPLVSYALPLPPAGFADIDELLFPHWWNSRKFDW